MDSENSGSGKFSDSGESSFLKEDLQEENASGCVRMWLYTTASKKNSLLNVWKESWFEANDSERRKNDSTNQILCISISFDNKRFITGGTDTYIRVYEIASHKPGKILQPSITAYNTLGHTSRITALAYHPKGRSDVRYLPIFVSAGWDDSIQIWNDQQNSSLWRVYLQFYGPHVAGSDGLDIDPIRNTILTSSWRRDRVPIQLRQFPEFIMGLDESVAEHQKESYKKPMPYFSNEPLSQATQGYVVKCDSTYQFALFAGSNKNIVSVVSLRHNAIIAEVTNLPCGVYSGAIFQDEDYKSRLKVLYTNGKTINLGRLSLEAHQ
ncbi:hypothetical protein EG68_09516 [Paragonimus skrjabini miyazakii]|uniref:Uncharacterized protein n=1 Tax=Paragonimus skrjabini miyazakii TaxID=59628 RepID=A0A8S9YHB7_9TREM|nr:hypothetical protein EG68_09516 [Paragonimus skrjabini miyazakii]